MENETYDLVVIGSGPGGYVGAIRASQLGLKTLVIEKNSTLGGTCLNVGCIPSKALLDSSEHYSQAKEEFSEHGIQFNKLNLDLKAMLGRKDKIVSDLTSGISFLFKKNKISQLQGTGRLVSENSIEVTDAAGNKSIVHAKNIMLATGSRANELPDLPYSANVVSSTEALCFKDVPTHLVVVGAGAIGLELGSVWLRLGSQVTVIEFTDKIGGVADKKVCKKLQASLKRQGMKFILKAKVTGYEQTEKGVMLSYEDLSPAGNNATLLADKVLVAAGRVPYSDGLGLEALGIEKNQRGFVVVDSHYRTKYQNIYAIGDLIPGPMLAHKAEEEGVAVAEIVSGSAGHVNYLTVPSVIYTWPELASVGKTEEELKSAGIKYRSGHFPFMANGRAKALGNTEGGVTVLAHQDTDRILGVHILGPRASDLIGEAVVAMEFSGNAEDLALSFHAHPTLSEAIREAALSVDKRARQF